MAVVTSFSRLEGKGLHRHRTDVAAGYGSFGGGPNGPIFQISTYGSAERQLPNKVSQTIQLDRAGAKRLWELLGETYGFK
jgi:hypothetical protein